MITQCCVEALYKLGKEVQAVTDIAKTFERRRCNHRTPLEPDACLTDVIGSTNKHRYVLAAQSKSLRTALSAIPGLPIIHFNPRGVLVLSPPSHATLKMKDAQEESRRLEGADLLQGVQDGENVIGAGSTATTSSSTAAAAPTKRSRAKGPNPLSVKKKKAAPVEHKREEKKEEVQLAAAKKSRRKRGKGLVKQVREEMAAEDLARDKSAKESAEGRASEQAAETPLEE